MCHFHFYPTFEIEAAWISNDKKALDVGVFEPFDWGRGIIGTTERIQGYSSPPCGVGFEKRVI